MPALCTEDGKV